MSDRPPRDTSPAERASAYERLFRSYRDAVFAYALRRTTGDQAQDVVAETFAVAWRRLDEVPAEPLPWLLGVARRVLANQRRTLSRQRALVERLEHQPAISFVEADVRADLASVVQALRSLSERDREILLLVAWEGLTPRDAAVVAGQPAAVFRLRLHRARRRLRSAVERAERGSSLRLTTSKGAPEPSCDTTT